MRELSAVIGTVTDKVSKNFQLTDNRCRTNNRQSLGRVVTFVTLMRLMD